MIRYFLLATVAFSGLAMAETDKKQEPPRATPAPAVAPAVPAIPAPSKGDQTKPVPVIPAPPKGDHAKPVPVIPAPSKGDHAKPENAKPIKKDATPDAKAIAAPTDSDKRSATIAAIAAAVDATNSN